MPEANDKSRRFFVSRRAAGLLLLLGAMAGAGCSSYLTMGRLPRGGDFRRSAVELKRRYPAFVEFAPSVKRYVLAPIQRRPPAEELFAAWGRPDRKGMVWWWWEFPLIVNRSYYWNKDDKRVTAVISRPLFIGFRPRVFSLDIAPAPGKREGPP